MYRPGRWNQLCDALSRFPPHIEIDLVSLTDAVQICAVLKQPLESNPVILGTPITRQELDEALQQEPRWNAVRVHLQTQQLPIDTILAKQVQKRAPQMCLIDKFLYKRNRLAVRSGTGPLLFVPHSLRQRLIEDFHRDPTQNSHLGIAKSLAKLQARFWWPNMRSDIAQVVLACLTCQQRKSPSAQIAVEPLAHFPLPTRCFERLHTDIVGPLPVTPRNNRYILTNVDAFSSTQYVCSARSTSLHGSPGHDPRDIYQAWKRRTAGQRSRHQLHVSVDARSLPYSGN